MDVTVVIVEQLELDGSLRTFRMQAGPESPITIALANEYEEPRSGPFHFLDERYERQFEKAFAGCRVRKIGHDNFFETDNKYSFNTSWRGIPTEQGRLSYYALYLPKFAIPSEVNFFAIRSDREYQKTVIRDDLKKRYVLYLECRSSYGSFDFNLKVNFVLSRDDFFESNYNDEMTSKFGAHPHAYKSILNHEQVTNITQFFEGDYIKGDQYNIKQAASVGPHSQAKNIHFKNSRKNIDLKKLSNELKLLRAALEQQVSESKNLKVLYNIVAAEEATQLNDESKVMEHLKAAGEPALQLAIKTNMPIAANTIRAALDL